MIIVLLLSVILSVIKFAFGILPSVPPLPQVITDGANVFLYYTDQASQLLVYLVSPPIWTFGMVTIAFFIFYDFMIKAAVRFIMMRIILRVVSR